MSSGRPRSWPWLLLTLGLATIPVGGVFTLSRTFFVRDLSLAFRSRFLFLRHSVFSGTFPLWDPYPANGQSAVNDALYQLFHLPSLLVRLLLPEVVAFNAWVALPVPLAAAGMFAFLRRHVGAPAATIGAVGYAVAGPIVSTTNFPNMSWSVAAVPYIFWAIDALVERPSASRGTWLALAVGLAALAGEPVSLAAALLLAGVYLLLEAPPGRRWPVLAHASAGFAAGFGLAAIQFLPLAAAGRHSVRGVLGTDDFWSFHPLALSELVIPHFFGDYFSSNLRELGWMTALNSKREPFYYTMYVGVPLVMLAAIAAFSRRRRTTLWTAGVVVCVLASLGSYTPFYPTLQAIAPPLRAFRFPVKYLSVASFGISTLAAMALQWLIDADVPRAAVRWTIAISAAVAVLLYLFLAWLLLAPALPIHAFYRLAEWVHVPSPLQGAEYLIFRARPLLTTLLLKLACGAFLVWVAASPRRERRLALGVLTTFVVVDLLVSNSSVNPTMALSVLAPPAWTHQIPKNSEQRIYVGARLGGYVNTLDVDAPKYGSYIDGYTHLEQRFIVVNQLVYHTSGLGLREATSYDLPELWPIEYAMTLGRFMAAPREDRLRFLQRAGVRWVILPTPPYAGAKPLATLLGVDQLKLYDAFPHATRAYVVPDALMGPDVKWQIEGMFQPRFDPSAGVLVSQAPPPASGRSGAPAPRSARIVEDGINHVVVQASLPADGYLALLDSYDPDWHVDVDGEPAPLMRANGLFRAVHLRAGTHVVTFTFRPSMFYRGAAITGVTGLALALWCAVDIRRRAAPERDAAPA